MLEARVLHICTANRCRSVIAERLAEVMLPESIVNSSAGIDAQQGEAIWPAAARELDRRRVPVNGFASRELTLSMLHSADLILAATRGQRDAVAAMEPSIFRRTFTWRELAWLLGGVSRADVPGECAADRLRALPALANSRRGLLLAPQGKDLDVEDPVGRSGRATAKAAALIESSLTVLAGLV